MPGKTRQAVVREDSGAFQEDQAAEQEHRQRRLQVALPLGPQDAGDDHVKDEEEGEGVLDPAGEMQDRGEDQQIGGDLNRDDPRPERRR